MKNIRITILREGALQLQICCNLSPEEMKKRKKEAERLLPYSGTRLGWQIELEPEDESLAPVPCADDEGYWHYIAMC